MREVQATRVRSIRGVVGRGVGGAFTLIEVIVAVGILAIVTIAIAAVFQTVGDTVTTGNRLSNLNRVAARIEQIMRKDFEGLEQGKGFLVIRNEYARRDWDSFDPNLYGDSAVPLFEGDTDARLRRIDEIAFFTSGQFVTRRVPLHPSMNARSTEARVYYGHGQRMPADVDGDGDVETDFSMDDEDRRFDRPRLDDLNDIEGARLGQVSAALVTNPNEYASEWLLMRHVTVLAPASSEIQELPDDVFGMNPQIDAQARRRVQDNSRQVGLQPAAHSIFQPVTVLRGKFSEYPSSLLGGGADGVRASSNTIRTVQNPLGVPIGLNNEYDASPTFLSGLVDVATTDLATIKSWVTRGDDPAVLPDTAFFPFTPREVVNGSIDRYDGPSGLVQARFSTQFNSARNTTGGNTLRDDQVQQEWMLAALPSIPYDPLDTTPGAPGFRVRAEDAPPRLFTPIRTIDDSGQVTYEPRYNTGYPTPRVQELMAVIEQADQEALVSSVFLPRCSEFIVEWSYGIVDRRESLTSGRDNPNFGQVIWHGLRRWNDLGVDGTYLAADDVLVADLFGDIDNDGIVEYDGVDIEAVSNGGGDFSIPAEVAQSTGPSTTIVAPRLEALTLLRDRANTADRPNPDGPAAEYVFGYFDRVPNGSNFENLDWPWPSLIRVTFVIADEADPSIEQAYQVVFRVRKPEGGRL
jgi:type II secretory pathway pseudopilin PulG